MLANSRSAQNRKEEDHWSPRGQEQPEPQSKFPVAGEKKQLAIVVVFVVLVHIMVSTWWNTRCCNACLLQVDVQEMSVTLDHSPDRIPS